MEKKTARNTLIDFFRLLFAFCIIGIHTDLFKDCNTPLFRIFTESLFRIGVPFYFITAGYFFADRLNDKARSDAYIFRLVKIYVIFEIIDIVLNFAVGFRYPITTVIQRFFTTGLNQIYWYMVSLIYTCFLCRKPWQKGYAKQLMLFGLALYLITMTFDSYSFLFAGTIMEKIGQLHRAVWAWPQGGLTESILFVSIGVYLKQNPPKIQHLNVWLILSLIMLVCEGWFCQAHGAADANCYFSLLLCSVFLFQFVLENPDHLYIPHAGDLSLYIYMTHPYCSAVSYAIPFIMDRSVCRYLFTAITALIVSVLIINVKQKKAAKQSFNN